MQFRQKQQQRGNWGKTSCVWLLDLWLRPVSLLWPGELCEFSRKCLILCVQGEENNLVEQVSEAAKSDRPKSITVCIHFHLTRSHRQIFGQGFPCYFTAPSANAVEKKRKLRKTEGESTFSGRFLWFLHLLPQTWPQSHPWEHGKKKEKNTTANQTSHTLEEKRLWTVTPSCRCDANGFMPAVPCLYMS